MCVRVKVDTYNSPSSLQHAKQKGKTIIAPTGGIAELGKHPTSTGMGISHSRKCDDHNDCANKHPKDYACKVNILSCDGGLLWYILMKRLR